jgi:hypothetical protein
MLSPVYESVSESLAMAVSSTDSSRSRWGSNPASLVTLAPWNSSSIERDSG